MNSVSMCLQRCFVFCLFSLWSIVASETNVTRTDTREEYIKLRERYEDCLGTVCYQGWARSFKLSHNNVVVGSSHITEASGLAASRKHPGIVYTHNDHGGDKGIFILSSTGNKQGTIHLKGVDEHDIEDIALGKCSSRADDNEFCIYIGDFGNSGHRAVNNIYRIQEPDDLDDQDVHIDNSNTLQFRWTEEDCETLMVDPSANVFIISKVHGGHGVIAQLPNMAWGTGTRVAISSTAKLNIISSHNDPVGGDISPDGTEVLIKAHNAVYYWQAGNAHDYLALLQTPGRPVAYKQERQGEAVCWDATGNGYYTLSEGSDQNLYHYIRD